MASTLGPAPAHSRGTRQASRHEPSAAEPSPATAAAPIAGRDAPLAPMEPFRYARGARSYGTTASPARDREDAAAMHSSAPALAPSDGHPLPARLRHGIEQLSGIAMDDVSVHYNSPRPAALQALAYAQGADIHLAPGQERYLPHEAWHVVQQKQRRVPPTLQMKAAAPLNDDAALEREAELMGRRAAAYPARDAEHGMASGPRVRRSVRADAPGAGGPAVVQRFELSELGMTELVTFVVTTAGLAGLYTLNLLRRNWPAGRGPLEILGFMKAAGFQEGLALSRLAGWSSESVLALAAAFGQTDPRLRRPVQDWIEVARLTGNDTPAEATTFSRLPADWSSESVLELATAFNHAGDGRRPAEDWTAIAQLTGDDTPAAAAAFSRLPADWTLPGIQKLLNGFASNTRGNLDADQWATIAGRLGNDLADDTIAFCRLRGWQFANIDALAAAFAHKRNHLSRQNWLEVARRFGNDQDVATILFCQLENWTWAGIRPLSVAFKAGHNDLSADQWSSVAARVTDNDADSAIAFCQLENWDWHSIDALSQAYANHQRGLTGEQWQAIAEPAAEEQRANIPGFLAQVRISDPDATGDTIAELAHAGDDRFEMLTVMLNTIGNIAVADLGPLVTAFLKHQAEHVATIPQFLQAVRDHNPETTATQVALLINAVAARGTLAQIRTLVNHVAARNTLVELTALVRTIQQRQAGTLLPATDALVQHMPLAANVCVTLRDIVNTVAGHGSFAEIDAMVQQAVASLGENDVQALQPLLQRNPATNTPVHVTAFLNALPPAPNALARYQLIQPRIAWFLRDGAPPHHGLRRFDAHGSPLAVGVGVAAFTCNAWAHFYTRHTYRYFNFGAADHLNGMWPQATDVPAQLNANLPGAVALGLDPVSGAPNHRTSAGTRIGTTGVHGVIAQLVPIGSADVTFTLAEINAIAPLR